MVNPSDYLSKAVQLLKAAEMHPAQFQTEQLAHTLSGASSMETLLPLLLPRDGASQISLQNPLMAPPYAFTSGPNGSMATSSYNFTANPYTEHHQIQSEAIPPQAGLAAQNRMDSDAFLKSHPPMMYSEPTAMLKAEEDIHNREEKRCKIELNPGVVLGVPVASCQTALDTTMAPPTMTSCNDSPLYEAQPSFPEDLVPTMRGTPTNCCKHACQPYLWDNTQGNDPQDHSQVFISVSCIVHHVSQ